MLQALRDWLIDFRESWKTTVLLTDVICPVCGWNIGKSMRDNIGHVITWHMGNADEVGDMICNQRREIRRAQLKAYKAARKAAKPV